MSQKTFAVSVFWLMAWSGSAYAQEARGSITGRISDASGAVVVNAKVTVANTLTNEARSVSTNDTGYYEVNFLDPSMYRVTVGAAGFKRIVRTGIELPVGTRLDIPMTMEVGGLAETVTVTAEAPLLETTTASGGRVLDQRQLVNLPFSDLNPFALTALAPGMQWTGQPEYRRPFDNGGTSSFNANGGVGQNEYSMDGMSVTGTGRRVGFVPPADSITEFKLETSNFDASQGFTSGAAINVVSKSGTNGLHGAIFDQHWQQRWNATPHFTRLRWEDQVRQGKISPDSQKQATGRSNNYGLSASGPVWIPKIVNGKNKYFWTVTWNGIKQAKAETTSDVNRTVPTLAERQGDFSALLNVPNGANLYTIYDPRSAQLAGSNVVRTPFPGNRGIPVLNPMYQAYVKLYPNPNNVPGLVTAQGTNNYLAFAMPKNENFNSIVNRFDVIPSDRHRFNFRWQWNDRLADEYDWTYETARGLHTNGLTRINKGINFGYLFTISPHNIFDFSTGFSRFEEGSRATEQTKYKPSEMGLPSYLDARAGDFHTLPRVGISGMETVSGGYPVVGSLSTMYAINATMTTIHGSHTWRYGWQARRNDWGALGPGNSSGSFDFGNSWMRRADNDNVSSSFGLGWAAFMMGMPTGMSIDTNGTYYFQNPRHAAFFQDDWRVSSRLGLQIGLRYEYEGGITERYNRGLSAVFLPDMKLPITDLVQAAYAANPRPELPASQFKVLGGTTYLGQNGYNKATKGTQTFLPKFGAVYQINLKTVLRAGWGMYSDTNGQGFFTGTNIRLNQLLRPYGFMGSTSGIRPGDNFNDKRGNVTYHDLQVLVERRFSKGLSSSFMYTWASSYVTDWVQNEFDTAPSERLNNNVRPHRIAWTGTYELPWGKGRTWLKQGFLGQLAGNWNTGVVFQWQPGPATEWGNRFFYGDINHIASLFRHDEVNSMDIHQWFDGSIVYRGTGAVPAGFTGFEGRSSATPGSYHVRVFPSRLDALREPGIINWDLKVERAFPIKERGNVRFSVDLLNALNHTNFSGPNLDPTNSNFGKLDTQRGLSRVIQFTMRVEF